MSIIPGAAASSLERFGHNLTALARQGAFAALADQDAVADRLFQILLRNNKSNPMLLDDDESWRFAILAEGVRRMAMDAAPEPLHSRQVIALDIEALFANPLDDALLYREQIQKRRTYLRQRLATIGQETNARRQALLNEEEPLSPEAEEWVGTTIALERFRTMCLAIHESAGAFILFVDHFHRLVGGDNGIDTANILVPMLARRQIQLIGACTLEQYRRYIERDAGFQRRFQEIVLPR